MWRTLIVNSGERLSLKAKQLIVTSGDHSIEVPIEDLYSVVIENEQVNITVSAINALTQNNVHVFFCDTRHLPVSLVLPLNTHYRVLSVLRKQMNMSRETKNAIWDAIIKAKIENQARVVGLVGYSQSVKNHLRVYRDEVKNGDARNREGLAAKIYFRELFGVGFIRMNEDIINAALNYGYAIVRAAVSKTLVAYGFNCALGIHHIGEYNPFNLTDDLMEPLRPLVDLWVVLNNESLVDHLTRGNRAGLINLMNQVVLFDGKRVKTRYAIDKYINSLVSCLDKEDSNLLKTPYLLALEMNEEKEDEQPLYENPSLF